MERLTCSGRIRLCTNACKISSLYAGGGGTHMLRHMGMCHPNSPKILRHGSHFGPKKKKSLRGGSHFTKFATKKKVKSAIFLAEKALEMGLDL